MNDIDLRTGRHCVFMLHCHLIFITKYRGKTLNNEVLSFIEGVMRDIAAGFEVEITEFNGESDHIHLLINYPPKVSLSKLINSLKGVSSRKVRQNFPDVRYHWTNKNTGALWSPSYFAGSIGGAPLEVLKRYIEQQDRPHKQ
ncbi:IS200/IS605 family transposase [Marinomonas sp. 2405UD68-3]|uniref:IS200/IS605 family transposase n=1 Tax=Marinomonas sp. 2405UD68-3 TaxID=3391835 RepID=UPI0039C9435A